MIKRQIQALLLFVLLAGCASAPPVAQAPQAAQIAVAGASSEACPNPAAIIETRDLPHAAVRYLADDALEGRLAGSASERCAGDYIASEFQRLGLRPAGDDGTFFQEVPLASAINPHAPGGTGRNVVAMIEGSDPGLRAEAVVIGAHYDHLGRGPMFSLAPDQPNAIHNGADDNASGVAAMLKVAEQLRRGTPPARSVVFIAFTGEEYGLLGSAYYAAHPAVPLARTRAMLNMDMVGRLEGDPLLIYGTETATEWAEILGPATEAEGVAFHGRGDGYGASDHTSFYARDIPVLHFFTNTHDDYHRPSDSWERIDYEGLTRVAGVVTRVARAVADRPLALTLQRGAGAPPRAAAGGGYGAYLGTVPDFTPVEQGVRISGVRADSPAEQAGLRGGDVLVRMDEDEISDLNAFTEALRTRKPGDRVRVTVLREGREVTLDAVLSSRSPQ